MGILRCKEIAEQRRGPTFAGDGSYQRTYSRVWQVITDGYKAAGLEAVTQGSEIPSLYTTYDTRPQGGTEFDNGAIVMGYDSYQPDSDTPNLWYVRVDYSSRSLDPQVLNAIGQGLPDFLPPGSGTPPAGDPAGGGEINKNPLLQPLQVSFRTQKEMVTLYKSFGSWSQSNVFVSLPTRFLNSADQAYSPGPQVPRSTKVLTIVRNEQSYDPTFDGLGQYEDTVNEHSFLGFNAGTVRCDSIDGQNAYENGVGFVIVTYQFSVKVFNEGNGEAWDWKVVDEGTHALVSTQKAVPTDRAGRNLGGRVALNGVGAALGTGLTPIFNTYRIYRRTDLNDLGLP